MELLNSIASYWNEFLLAGAGFFTLCLISLAIGGLLINFKHHIIGTIVALIGTIFGIATRYALIIGIVLGTIKLFLKWLV